MNFLDKAKELVGITGQKTEEVINVQKLRFSAASVTNKISKNYENLGKLYYQSKVSGKDETENLTPIIEEIDKLTEELESLKNQIAEIKGSIICSKCKEQVSETCEFCPKCGEKLSK